MKKIIGIVLILAMSIILIPTAAFAEGEFFSDVPSTHWAYDYISKLREEGVINGYSDGTFRPSANVTVDEFAALAVRACGRFSEEQAAEEYADVEIPGKNWASNYHLFASDNHFYAWDSALGGIQPGKMIEGSKPCTREMAAGIISDILIEDKGKNIKLSWLANLESKYAPTEDFSWSGTGRYNNNSEFRTKYAVSNTISYGVISGYADGSFGGERNLTRAEASAMIYRLMFSNLTPSAEAIGFAEYNALHIEPAVPAPSMIPFPWYRDLAETKGSITQAEYDAFLDYLRQLGFTEGISFEGGWERVIAVHYPNEIDCVVFAHYLSNHTVYLQGYGAKYDSPRDNDKTEILATNADEMYSFVKNVVDGPLSVPDPSEGIYYFLRSHYQSGYSDESLKATLTRQEAEDFVSALLNAGYSYEGKDWLGVKYLEKGPYYLMLLLPSYEGAFMLAIVYIHYEGETVPYTGREIWITNSHGLAVLLELLTE